MVHTNLLLKNWVFPKFMFRGTTKNFFFISWGQLSAKTFTGRKRDSWQRKEIAPVLPIVVQKFPQIFKGIFGLFRGLLKYLNVYCTIFRGTPDDVPRETGWETMS